MEQTGQAHILRMIPLPLLEDLRENIIIATALALYMYAEETKLFTQDETPTQLFHIRCAMQRPGFRKVVPRKRSQRRLQHSLRQRYGGRVNWYDLHGERFSFR